VASPVYGYVVSLGRGKTEHAGARDMTRKHGHWGFTEEAKAWASRARRRDEREELRRGRAEMREALPADADEIGKNSSQATDTTSVNDGEAPPP
jgi:hypothetical protein